MSQARKSRQGVRISGKVAERHHGAFEEVIIPEGVEEIGRSAFANDEILITVDLPSTLRIVGEMAFQGCHRLVLTRLPEGVEEIRSCAFAATPAITSFRFPEKLHVLGEGAFKSSGLTHISFPDWMTVLPKEILMLCSHLTSVDLPQGLTQVGASAFEYCSALPSISLPSGVRVLGETAFYHCVALESITLPEGLEEIGRSCFSQCASLRSVYIPASVRVVGEEAFGDCCNLEEILVDPRNPNFMSRDGMLLSGDGTTLLCLPAGRTGTVTIPQGVRRVARGSMEGCERVKELHFPPGIEEYNPGYTNPCRNATVIRVGGALEPFVWLGQQTPNWHRQPLAMYADSVDIRDAPKALQDPLLRGFLRDWEAGEHHPREKEFLNWIRAHQRTLWRRNFCREVLLQEGLLTASFYEDCVRTTDSEKDPELMAQLLEYSRRFLGEGALAALERRRINRSLRKAQSQVPAPRNQGIWITAQAGLPGQATLISCRGNDREMEIPALTEQGSLVTIGRFAFLNQTRMARHGENPGIRSLVVPEGVIALEEFALAGAISLEELTLPESLKTIGARAFAGCDSLRNLVIPAGVARIPEDVLDAPALETVTFLGPTQIVPTPSVREEDMADVMDFSSRDRKILLLVRAPEGAPAQSWARLKRQAFEALEPDRD